MKQYSIIVIGAGAGGLVVAIGAAKAGQKVLLIEKGHYGGDCTNFGCIPSKSLISSAHSAESLKEGLSLGLAFASKKFDAHQSLERVRQIVAEVRSHEDPEALEKFGVETRTGTAVFQDPRTLKVNDEIVSGKQIVIATGSSPFIPAIQGLDQTPYLTNETIFELKDIPETLAVMGGGPIGCELAQAFQRLGSKVSLIHTHEQLLNKEELPVQKLIAEQFTKEGISLYLGLHPQEVHYTDHRFQIIGNGKKVEAQALLVSVGRRPHVASLNLEAAGVKYSEKGIPVDAFGRTNQKHIWAVGDVIGAPFFTHWAEYQARCVLTSLILPFKKKIVSQAIPRVTYTDPEIASAGLTEEEAEKTYRIATYTIPFHLVDRAITAGRTEGFVKIVTKKWSSQILGCTIVSPRAGEMLGELTLAMFAKIPLRKLSRLIHPYPTYNQAIRQAADLWLTQTILPRLQHMKRFLPLAILLIGMGILYFSGIYRYFSFATLKNYHQTLKAFLAAHPVLTPILYNAAYIILTALSIPGAIFLTLLGGYLFPQPWSTFYVIFSATSGATIIFLAAKTAIGDLLRQKAGPFLRKMEKGFRENAASYLLFLRFVPLFPFWIVNLAPAFFGVPLTTFIWTTLVGITPGSLALTLVGAGLDEVFETQQTFSMEMLFNIKLKIALILLGILALTPIVIKKIKGHDRNSSS